MRAFQSDENSAEGVGLRVRASTATSRGFTQLSIQKCLLEQALDIERAKRPTGSARSKR